MKEELVDIDDRATSALDLADLGGQFRVILFLDIGDASHHQSNLFASI